MNEILIYNTDVLDCDYDRVEPNFYRESSANFKQKYRKG